MRTLLLLLLPISVFIAAASADLPKLLRTSVEMNNSPKLLQTSKGICDSWRLSVETNNHGPWETIMEGCEAYVRSYILEGDQYLSDSEMVAFDSYRFAKTVEIAAGGKDLWIFDIDETLLSNAWYIEVHGHRPKALNEVPFSPALPASLSLYNWLLSRGFKIVLLTGRPEEHRDITEANLVFAGYTTWERLILRSEADVNKTATVYKSEKRAELVAEGYKIHGSSGDQWSDLLGSPLATRSFKLPNPMYYIA